VRLPLADPRFLDLLAAWGSPYSYGAGAPNNAVNGWPYGVGGVHGGVGWDCSGFAQAALVRLSLLSGTAPDRSAAALYTIMAPVPDGQEQLGDLAFYGAATHVVHVMVVVAPGVVLGARGGDQNTNGDQPKALVQLEPLKYWNLFLECRRMPK
jgi:cell wall-associated NlpC family hydrolase